MSVQGISHVCLKTPDLGATERFYTGVLGFPRVFTFTREGAEDGFYLKVSERQFIEVFAGSAVENDVGTQALSHVCFETDDMDGLHARLLNAGFAPDDIKLGCDQSRQFWVRDPSGLNVEFHEYTPRSLQFTGGTVEVDW